MQDLDPKNLDQITSLAFSLHSSPGSYALVLGAGISIVSGVPSAWGVQQQLLSKLARLENAEPEDFFDWYTERFGTTPTYEGLLEHLAPTQHDRQSLLRGFFEPTEVEREQSLKEPTLAHRSIAQLVAAGSTRVILTLNFDRLMETALRDEGIETVVISQPSDIRGMAPLHTIQAIVIHLHGDYLNPTTMLNTKHELSEYDSEIQHLLARVTYDYGLIFVGWSATYDPALRTAIKATPRRVYKPYWIEPGNFSTVATDLKTAIGATHLATDADTAMGRLIDNVNSLADKQALHPLTLVGAVGTAKRYLAGRPTAIGLHDHIKQEIDTLHRQPDILQSVTGTESANGGYRGMVARVEEATSVVSSLRAASAYWGDESTDRWWIEEIPRLSTRSQGSGLVKILELPKVSSVQMFYAAGLGAIASGRFNLVKRLLTIRVEETSRGLSPLCIELTLALAYRSSTLGSKRVRENLRPLFVDHLKTGAASFNEAWEMFELLRLVEATYHRGGATHVIPIERLRHAKAQNTNPLEHAMADGNAVHEQLGFPATDALSQAKESYRKLCANGACGRGFPCGS